MPFKLAGRLSLDGSGFKAGIARAKSAVQGLGAKMKSALKSPMVQMGLAAGAAMMGVMVKKTIEWGTNMRDLGVKFGVSTKFLQEMDYAASQTGVTIEGMMKGYKKMALTQAAALDPLTGATERAEYLAFFNKLGVSTEKVKSLNPQELFMAVARAMKNFDAGAVGSQEAVAGVFGKSGVELINTFKVGVDGLVESFQAIDATVSDETIERLGAAGDKMEEMSTRWKAGWADSLGFVFKIWDHLTAHMQAGMDAWAERVEMLRNLDFKGFAEKGFAGVGEIADRQLAIMQAKDAKRAEDKRKRDAVLVQDAEREAKAPEGPTAEELKKEAEQKKAAATAEAKRLSTWTGFKADKLEKIGGRMGMATSQLNISQQQLALMVKAQEKRAQLDKNVAELRNVIINGG